MYIMIIILNDEHLIKKILSLLMEFELHDSTVLDGESIENIAAKKIPLFSDFNNLFGKESVYNKTIISHVPNNSTIERFVKLCKQEGIDFTEPDVGCLMSIPCNYFIGEK